MPEAPELAPLVRKLQSITTLSPEAKQAILALPTTVRDIKADHDIVREMDRPTHCCVVLEGFLCRYKMTREGKRQIFSFHTPGDTPDFQSLHLKVMDHSLGTLTRSRVAFIPHESLRTLTHTFPAVADALWRDTLVDAAIFREWMIGIGRRSASTRIAHLICEVFVRQRAVGLTRDYAMTFPITQAEIGDALGLSTVHVNRSLQELRAKGLIAPQSNVLEILDWTGLKEAGEFDETYLHLSPEHRGAA